MRWKSRRKRLPFFAALAWVGVLGIGACGSADNSGGLRENGKEPRGKGPQGAEIWRVTWRTEGDSLVVTAIDSYPTVARSARNEEAAAREARPRRSAVPWPPRLQSVAPSHRDRRAVRATLLTMHDGAGRLLAARALRDRPTIFLDGYDARGGGPRPHDPPVRSATILANPDARVLALHSLQIRPPVPRPERDSAPVPRSKTEPQRFLWHLDRGGPGAPPIRPEAIREVDLVPQVMIDLMPPDPGTDDFHGILPQPDPDPDGLPRWLDFEGLGIPEPLDLREILKYLPPWEWRRRPQGPFVPPLPDFDILGVDTLWYPTETAYPTEGTSYRVVILGDGFDGSEADQDRFARLSELFTERLLAEPPFDSVRESLWIARVRVASQESGISYCTDTGRSFDSFYRVRGCYVEDQPAACDPSSLTPGANNRAYVGVDEGDTWRIVESGRLAFEGEEAHLHVMITNCDVRGGRADPRPEVRTAFVTLPPSLALAYVDVCDLDWVELDAAGRDSAFASVALHECAHVMAGLMDEYVTCMAAPLDVDGGLEPWPNLATKADLDAGAVPWLEGVEDPPIHRYGEAPCTGKHNWMHGEVAAAYDELGAYWGCAYVTEWAAENQSCSCLLTNAVGRNFFRPQGRCKMRSTNWPFCAVCADTLKRVVLDPRPLDGELDVLP